MEAVVFFVILMVWTVSAVFFTTGWANGRIVMKMPTLSVIAESLGLTTNRKIAKPGGIKPDQDSLCGPKAGELWWIDMVLYHGFEKTLRGVVNDLRNGGLWTRSDNGWYWKIETSVHTIENIPQHIGKALEYIKAKLECGCTTNPYEGMASCSEIIEMEISRLVEKYGDFFDLPRLAVMQYPSLHTLKPEYIEAAVRIERDVVFTECCGQLPVVYRYPGGGPQVVYCDKCDRELYDNIGC